MTQATPTFRQIKAQVAAIRRKVPNTRSVAIRTKAKWTGNTRQIDDGEMYLIHQCDSPLAMRLALREGEDQATTVLITDLDDHEVGDDILVRLKPRKLVPLDSWQIIKALFQARTIDPRLTKHGWIAELLMELVPTSEVPPVASGFLDAETAWSMLLARILDLAPETPDLLSLLKWSTDPTHIARFRAAPDAFREASIDWLVNLAGPSAQAILECAARNERADTVPIGLAAGVIFHPQATGKLERPAGKLEERYLGGHSPDALSIRRWAAAATEVVRLQLNDARLKQQLLQRADDILREVGAEAFAWLSDTSPMGFDLRLADFGKHLSNAVAAQPVLTSEHLIPARQALLQHDRSSRERRRLERIGMAMRLLRWLAERDETQQPRSLAEAATAHLAEGGFVDWARLSLRTGDPVRELSDAYANLFERATDARERDAEAFAKLLRDWTISKTTDDTIVPVEQVLGGVVAPLAAQGPVLVIVIDGMSVAVFRELMADVLGHDWVLLTEERSGLRPGMATIPSVTEVSRTSLLCGRLLQGNAAIETAGFAEHPGLLSQCRSGFPPVLFHKASLQETGDASLAADVRKEIGSTHRKIVGVVVNAVDDHLLKGEQIDTRWTRDEIKVLPVLLHEAKMSGRTVIMISDHGHVLDSGAKGQVFEGGERWRMADGQPATGELQISGPRVVIPETKKLIAPWTEKIRYGVKKNGYHGGVTPQEMIVPIAVLSAKEDFPVGWVEAPVDLPAWWDLVSSSGEIEKQPEPKLKPAKPKQKPPGLLFDPDEVEVAKSGPVVTAPVVKPIAEWITGLLASAVFEEQKQLGGRAVPPNEVFSQLLVAIDERGGKITSPALARAIQFSPIRLRGLLAVAQRILNVDGFGVLTRDDASDTIELNRDLLLRQFDLM